MVHENGVRFIIDRFIPRLLVTEIRVIQSETPDFIDRERSKTVLDFPGVFLLTLAFKYAYQTS